MGQPSQHHFHIISTNNVNHFFQTFLMGHLSQWCHFRHNRTFVQRNVIYFHYCGTVGQLSQQKKSEKKLDYVSSQHDVDERITGVTEISWTFVTIMGHFSQCWDFWLQKCHKSVKWDSGTAVPLKKNLRKKFSIMIRIKQSDLFENQNIGQK